MDSVIPKTAVNSVLYLLGPLSGDLLFIYMKKGSGILDVCVCVCVCIVAKVSLAVSAHYDNDCGIWQVPKRGE